MFYFFLKNLKGATLIAQEDYKEAVEAYEEALLINPLDHEVCNNLGIAYKRMGVLEKAVKSYTKALELNPKYVNAYNNLGIALTEMGEHQNAIDNFHQAISLNNKYAEAYFNLANTYALKSETDKSIEAYKKAIELRPNFSQAYNNLANTLQSLDQSEKAIELYNKAIEANPNNHEAFNNLLDLLTFYQVNQGTTCTLSALQNRIQSLSLVFAPFETSGNEYIAQQLQDALKLVDDAKIHALTNKSQIFRRSQSNMNCERHFRFFYE